jgi:HD-like signal output (HDOD) protein
MSIPSAPDNGWKTVRLEVLERTESLPSLNSVVAEFLALARRDFFTAKDFETVISKDQALVARLLKVANSGLYGRSRSITSIPEAVVLIGVDNLKKIVYAVSSEGLIRQQMKNYDYHPDQGFWLHSMGVGFATKVLVEASGRCPLHGEEGFVAGLLHDVGKLVIEDFLPDSGPRSITREEEINAVGLDHAELGEHLLKQWSLPVSTSATVRFHHEYLNGGDFAGGAAALALAQGICSTWDLGRTIPMDLSQEVPVEKFQDLADFLGLETSKWDQVIWDIRQILVGLDEAFAED